MVSVMLYPCIFCVGLLLDLFVMCVACFTVFVNCLVKHSAYMFGCGCYFVVEWYGGVEIGWRCSVGQTVYGLPSKLCGVPVISVCV